MNRENLEKTTKLLPLRIQLFAESSEDGKDGEKAQSEENNGGDSNNGEQKSEPEKKYTDDDVNNISKKNVDKATKKLMKDLGIDDIEEAKSILANARAEKEKNKTAEDKTNELTNSLSEKDKVISQKNDLLVSALLENSLMHEGVEPSKIARAVRMISTTSVLNEEGDIDNDLMKAEVDKLLKEFPEFKKKSEENTNKGFKFGSDGKQDTGKIQENTSSVKRWNRFR